MKMFNSTCVTVPQYRKCYLHKRDSFYSQVLNIVN